MHDTLRVVNNGQSVALVGRRALTPRGMLTGAKAAAPATQAIERTAVFILVSWR